MPLLFRLARSSMRKCSFNRSLAVGHDTRVKFVFGEAKTTNTVSPGQTALGRTVRFILMVTCTSRGTSVIGRSCLFIFQDRTEETLHRGDISDKRQYERQYERHY